MPGVGKPSGSLLPATYRSSVAPSLSEAAAEGKTAAAAVVAAAAEEKTAVAAAAVVEAEGETLKIKRLRQDQVSR